MDILIRNGLIVDGSGAPPWRGDLAIHDGHVKAIGENLRERADQIINADGLVVAPGFVDILNHADAYLTILKNPASESLIAQGITTAVIGNCGASLAPITHGKLIAVVQKWADIRGMNIDWERFREFLDCIDRLKPGINIAGLVGHATLRRTILGDDPRKANERELEAMAALLEGALSDGAFGLSYAPSYAHARVAPMEEIVTLASLAAKFRGYLAVHLRDESANILEALEEAFDIARRANLPLEISHLRAIDEAAKTKFNKVLDAIMQASGEGLNVHFDLFPWRTSSTVLYLLFPQWAQEGGLHELRKRLRDTATREKILGELRRASIAWSDFTIAEGHNNQTFVGKSLDDVARARGISPEESVIRLFLEHEGRVLLFRKGGDHFFLRKAIVHPRSFIASAGGGYREEDHTEGTLVHPRSFGAMPKLLETFVREEHLLPLEVAIAKISGGPAAKIGLKDRGAIAIGNAADLVIFDPEQIGSRATMADPFHYASGIKWVLVNGNIALNPDGITGIRAGRTLRKTKG
jgi:N-acyl-D-aspartate/D-glutamate deacylase